MPLPASTSSSQNDHADTPAGSDEDLDCYESISVHKRHLDDCTWGRTGHATYCHIVCFCSCWSCAHYRHEKKALEDKCNELVLLASRILNQTKTTL